MPLKNAAVSVASRARIARLAHDCVHVDQKKGAQLPPFHTTLVAPDPEDSTSTILEPSRLWSFVLKKPTTPGFGLPSAARGGRWSLLPLGIGASKTCQRLWQAIASESRQGHCFTDFLKISASVIPQEQHTAVGKETGETAHVERWNNTLRQRLARFVRMTVSFSQSEVMHDACLLLFLHRSNTERAILLK